VVDTGDTAAAHVAVSRTTTLRVNQKTTRRDRPERDRSLGDVSQLGLDRSGWRTTRTIHHVRTKQDDRGVPATTTTTTVVVMMIAQGVVHRGVADRGVIDVVVLVGGVVMAAPHLDHAEIKR